MELKKIGLKKGASEKPRKNFRRTEKDPRRTVKRNLGKNEKVEKRQQLEKEKQKAGKDSRKPKKIFRRVLKKISLRRISAKQPSDDDKTEFVQFFILLF